MAGRAGTACKVKLFIPYKTGPDFALVPIGTRARKGLGRGLKALSSLSEEILVAFLHLLFSEVYDNASPRINKLNKNLLKQNQLSNVFEY